MSCPGLHPAGFSEHASQQPGLAYPAYTVQNYLVVSEQTSNGTPSETSSVRRLCCSTPRTSTRYCVCINRNNPANSDIDVVSQALCSVVHIKFRAALRFRCGTSASRISSGNKALHTNDPRFLAVSDHSSRSTSSDRPSARSSCRPTSRTSSRDLICTSHSIVPKSRRPGAGDPSPSPGSPHCAPANTVCLPTCL